MKGIVLAGGTGSRLRPLTDVINKHLLPVGDKPMIFYPIAKLVEAGIKEILVVTGTEHMGMMVQTLGSGTAFGCSFTYKVQDESGGIAQALGLARNFCKKEKFCVLLGDNIFFDSIGPWADAYEQQECGAKIVLANVTNPERFGVAFVYSDRIKSIVEKPTSRYIEDMRVTGHSAHIVTGVYFYDDAVFTLIDNLSPSARGELEITDVNNAYLQRRELSYDVMNGYFTDAGTHYSLWHANMLVSGK